MARADILLSIVKSAIGNDSLSLRKTIEALAADERSKNHHILADRLSELLSVQNTQINKLCSVRAHSQSTGKRDFAAFSQVQCWKLKIPSIRYLLKNYKHYYEQIK